MKQEFIDKITKIATDAAIKAIKEQLEKEEPKKRSMEELYEMFKNIEEHLKSFGIKAYCGKAEGKLGSEVFIVIHRDENTYNDRRVMINEYYPRVKQKKELKWLGEIIQETKKEAKEKKIIDEIDKLCKQKGLSFNSRYTCITKGVDSTILVNGSLEKQFDFIQSYSETCLECEHFEGECYKGVKHGKGKILYKKDMKKGCKHFKKEK